MEASVNAGFACDDILQVRKSCSLKLAGLTVLKLRTDLVHADDEKKLEEVQTQSNNIATKWVEEYKDKELDNSGSVKDAEEKYLSII